MIYSIPNRYSNLLAATFFAMFTLYSGAVWLRVWALSVSWIAVKVRPANSTP